MSTDLVLKLKAANGDLQQITSSEENYLAYRAGLQLKSSAGTSVGDLTNTQVSGSTAVGSHIDTKYLESVGDHPVDGTNIITVTSGLYQRGGTADYNSIQNGNTRFKRPVSYSTKDGKVGIHQFADSDMNVLVDRLNSIIATNDYVGCYKLGATSPGSDYTSKFEAFSDTRTDNSVTPYYIWQRTTQTSPTSFDVAHIQDSDGYDGIQMISDGNLNYTFGQWAKTRRAIAGNIGSYQLRSSSQGVPTDTGSWKSVGSATDTRNDLTPKAYTRTRVSSYAFNNYTGRVSTYSGEYVNNSVGLYTGNFLGDYTNYVNAFTGNYNRTFVGDFTREYVGNYLRTRTSNFNRVSTRTRTSNFIGNYTGDYAGNYVGEYTTTRSSIFTGNRTITRNSSFTATRASSYTGNYNRNFIGDFVGDYSRGFAGDYAGNYVGNFLGNRESAFTRTRVSSYNRTFVGNYNSLRQSSYSRDFLNTNTVYYAGNYAGNYIKERTSAFRKNPY